MAKLLTSERAIFIGINGTEKLNEHSFRWARTETDSSHQAVQQALAKAAKNNPVNKQKVALMGFSQGALHSAHLLAKHPNDYVGALLLSAGGMQTEIKLRRPQVSDWLSHSANRSTAVIWRWINSWNNFF